MEYLGVILNVINKTSSWTLVDKYSYKITVSKRKICEKWWAGLEYIELETVVEEVESKQLRWNEYLIRIRTDSYLRKKSSNEAWRANQRKKDTFRVKWENKIKKLATKRGKINRKVRALVRDSFNYWKWMPQSIDGNEKE